MHIFTLKKSYVNKIKFVFLLSFLLLILVNLWAFLPDEKIGDPEEDFQMSLCASIFLVLFMAYAGYEFRKLYQYDIECDDNGLWHKYKGKNNGFVSWLDISEVKEKFITQRLDIHDFSGKNIIRVSYDLTEYDLLRSHIVESMPAEGGDYDRDVFKKIFGYHLFMIFGTVFVSALMIMWAETSDSIFLGYTGLAFILVVFSYEYLKTPTGICLGNHAIEIRYPLSKKEMKFHEIQGVHLVDQFERGHRIPEVWVDSKRRDKPFKLRSFGVDANVLYRAILKRIPS